MIRTTIIPDKQMISFKIPKDYIGKQIGVIAFAKEEAVIPRDFSKEKVTFNALSLDTRGYKFDRSEANER
jgi:hypothetical protein